MAKAKDVIRSVDKAAEGAFRTAGRWAGKAIGNLIAPVVGGQAVGAIGDALGRLIYRIGQFWLALLAANFILTIVGVAIFVVFTAFALFVINSGAYIVPPAQLIPGGPGGDIGQVEGCFALDSSWNQSQQGIAGAPNVAAATRKMTKQPAYMQKLCGNNRTIVLSYCPTRVLYGGLTVTDDQICFGVKGVADEGAAFYTLAHESGHILDRRTDYRIRYLDEVNLSELPASGPKQGLICTYPIDVNPPPSSPPPISQAEKATLRDYFWYWRNTPSPGAWVKAQAPIIKENFAEMIALYYVGGATSSTRSLENCPSGFSLQNTYPSHYNFANSVLFNYN